MSTTQRPEVIAEALSGLSAAHLADACVALSIPFRVCPPAIKPLFTPIRVAGWARPVMHRGSVDVFFEAMAAADEGDVLVIDNGGRWDEGCIGDLVVAEAAAYRMAGVVVWGAHRDSAELKQIGLPVYSTGACPAGPRELRDAEPGPCMIGHVEVTSADYVIGDDDGVLFIEGSAVSSLVGTARKVATMEAAQRRSLAAGTTLHQQFEWDQYVMMRNRDASYTFRKHLSRINKAIEK